jgi:D-alanyl-D-alanine carboxypeptidase
MGLARIVQAGVPGAVARVRDRSRITVATAGVADLRTGRVLGPSDPFRVGSITKTFVAAVVLQLAAEHRLNLGDNVEDWLPGLLPYGENVTVRELLQHTSGIPDHMSGATADALLAPLLEDPGHRFTPVELVRSVVGRPLQSQPGSRWAYSNTNYILLGLIVERVTGKPLARALDERIIRPLALRGTSLKSGAPLPVRSVRGYLLPGNPFLPVPAGRPFDVTGINPSFTWAAGALVSTTRDLDRFYQALLSGRLVPASLLAEMTASRPITAGSGYGLGLLRISTPCGPAYGHDGEIFGFTSLALTTQDTQRSVVLLATTSHPSEGRPATILDALLSLATETLCARA